MQRLSGMDSMLLWRDAHIEGLVILDASDSPEFGFEHFREYLEKRVPLIPSLHLRVQHVPLGIDLPIWVNDSGFDLDRHVDRATVEAAGSERELAALVSELISSKLDLTHPPWRVWFIDGLADGRKAYLMKMHHAMFDGMGALGIARVLMDPEPDPAPPPPLPGADTVEPQRSAIELSARGVVNLVASAPRAALLAVQTVRQVRTLVPFLRREDAPALPLDAPRVPFNGPVGPRVSYAVGSWPLEDAKRIKNELGVTINDVVLAVVAGALRSHLIARDALPDRPLLAVVPFSTRTEEEEDQVGNLASAMTISLPTHIADPVERVRAIRRATQSAKEMTAAVRVHHVTGFTEVLWAPVLAAGTRLLDRIAAVRPLTNVAISNMPGPPERLYCAGVPVEHLYPIAPLLMGMGIALIVGSYAGWLDLSVLVDPELVGDGWTIVDDVRESFDELFAAATTSA